MTLYERVGKNKFNSIYKDNLINNGQRIVLYGSSHCDYGLSAREISRQKLRQSIYVIMELKGKDTIKNLKVN